MTGPIVEPMMVRRLVRPGQTLTHEVLVRIVPQGSIRGFVINGGSVVRLKSVTAWTKEIRAFDEEELQLFPEAVREEYRRRGVQTYTEYGSVGANESLAVWPALSVSAVVELTGPLDGTTGATDATLVLEANNRWDRVEIPVHAVTGGVQVEFLGEGLVAYQGQEAGVLVRITLPPGHPASDIGIGVVDPDFGFVGPAVHVPAGGTAVGALRLRADSDAPLGEHLRFVSVSGLAPSDEFSKEFTFSIRSFSVAVAAMNAIDSKAAVTSEGPPGPRTPIGAAEPAGNGGFVRRYTSGNIYWTAATGARWVYGAVLQKYLQHGAAAGFLGFPMTDERATSDFAGRFNEFEGGSIYYTSQTGAHEIHGPLRDRWMELGSIHSFLGYPTYDKHNGYSSFQRGTIKILNDESVITTSDARVIESGVIHTPGDTAANGRASLTISSSGAWIFTGKARATGALSYDVLTVFSFDFRDAGGVGFTFAEKGDVEGTLVLGGNREHVWSQSGSDARIRDNWEALKRARVTIKFTVDFGPGDFLALVGTVLGVPLAVVGLVVAALFIGTTKMCGVGRHVRRDPITNEEVVESGIIFVPSDQRCPPGTDEPGG